MPVSADQLAAVPRMCVLVRPEPDPAGGQLVVLRDTADARVLPARKKLLPGVQLLEEARERDPENAEVLLSLGTACQMQRNRCMARRRLDGGGPVRYCVGRRPGGPAI